MSYSFVVPPNPNQGHFPTFSVVPLPIAPNVSQPQLPAPRQPQETPPKFKAPAHKHAHHLHSIPPREKSTRTLIIDHMLWVHSRTRFAQARAELGMTDRTGGPSSPHYAHRERPENYEEEEEEGSDGEDVWVLKAREGGPGHRHNDEEDERRERQELGLARSLRIRAEGLEKVVTSMLDQPPPVLHPIIDDDSPKPSSHPHTLPNGVRLRLALGTVINDLFARQAPPPPYRHHHHPPPITLSGNASDLGTTPGNSPVMQKATPVRAPSVSSSVSPLLVLAPSSPFSLMLLSTISAEAPKYTPTPRVRALYIAGADPSTANSPPSLRCPRHLHIGCQICVEAKQPVRAPGGSGRARAASGTNVNVNAYGANVNGNVNARVGGGTGMGGTTGGLTGWQESSGIGSGLARPGVQGSVLRRKSLSSSSSSHSSSPFPSTSSSTSFPPPPTFLPTSPSSSTGTGTGMGRTGMGTGNTRLSDLIPRFIRLSALVALELGREMREGVSPSSSPSHSHSPLDSPESPSPHSHSGTHSGGEGSHSRSHSDHSDATRQYANEEEHFALPPTTTWYLLLAGLLTRAVLEGYLTGGWRGMDGVDVLLGVGRAVRDNTSYDHHAEWNNGEGEEQSGEGEDEDIFAWFDPDDLPSLRQATIIMFPSLYARTSALAQTYQNQSHSQAHPQVQSQSHAQTRGMEGTAGAQNQTHQGWRPEGAEAEFEAEMEERMKRFFTLPPLTPDLSTHLEDLAWHYPAEPVERAALRFCEAVAKWRGKPELETYKKPPTSSHTYTTNDNIPTKRPTSPITMESLVHSNPASPTVGRGPGVRYASQGVHGQGQNTLQNQQNQNRVQKQPESPQQQFQRPAIEKYFAIPTSSSSHGGNAAGNARTGGNGAWRGYGSKRRRSGDGKD